MSLRVGMKIRNLDAALSYGQRGYHILPLHAVDAVGCTCRKSSCDSPGKHPRTAHGVKDASTEDAVIRRWWTQWPEANIGIATGEQSGVLVLDVDPRNGGLESLQAAEREFGSLPQTVMVETGGAGRHYYFSYNAGIRGRTGFRPGLDLKTDGGYVVAPPSRHISGKLYRFAPERALGDIALAACPAWLLQTLPENERPGPDDALFTQGNRNSSLFKLGRDMARSNPGVERLTWFLSWCNKNFCHPPLDESEVLEIAANADKYAKNSAAAQGKKDGGVFSPRPLGALIKEVEEAGEMEPKWIWFGYIPEATFALLAGSPKTGKSTIAAQLVAAIAKQEAFLGQATTRVKVLWLALEERPQDLARRFKKLGVSEGVEVHVGPLRSSRENMEKLRKYVEASGIKLVVVDTLAKFWNVRDENSAAEVDNAVLGILELTRSAKVAVVVLHHMRKSLGDYGEGIRGSSALFGSVDTALVMLRKSENRRTLEVIGRFDEAPESKLLDFVDGAYKAVGSAHEAASVESRARDKKFLGFVKEIFETVPRIASRAGEKESTARKILRRLLEAREVETRGSGRRGDPEEFRRPGAAPKAAAAPVAA